MQYQTFSSALALLLSCPLWELTKNNAATEVSNAYTVEGLVSLQGLGALARHRQFSTKLSREAQGILISPNSTAVCVCQQSMSYVQVGETIVC